MNPATRHIVPYQISRPILAIFVVATLIIAPFLLAQDKPPSTNEKASSSEIESLRKKRVVLEAQISKLSKNKDGKNEAEKSDDTADEETLARLRSIDVLYVQHQTRLEQLKDVESQLAEAEKELKLLDKFEPDEPKPYSFLFLEGLKDQLSVEEDRSSVLKGDVSAAEKLLKTAHEELDESEESRKKIAAQLDKKEGKKREVAAKDLALSELEVTLNRAKVGVRQAEVQVQNVKLNLCKTKQKQLEKKIKAIKKEVVFSSQDRDTQLAKLAGTQASLNRRRRDVEFHLQQLEPEKKSALKEFAEEKSPPKVMDAAIEAWRVANDAYQTEIVLLDRQVENLGIVRQTWKHRFDVTTTNVEPKKLKRWLDDLDEFIDQLKDMSSSLEHKRDTLHTDQAVALPDTKDAHAEEIAKWTSLRQARMQELRSLTESSIDDIKSTVRMLQRFRTELKTKIKETTGRWGNSLGDSLQSVFTYEVTDVDDQSVTVGRLLMLVLYVIVGIIAAYVLSRFIARRILPKMGLHKGTIIAFKSIVFYAMCIFFSVIAFQILRIPFAAFAFLGGAAAIAIGFGSQDIMNNFMSGIILLTEQPIRVGDVVELDDIRGVVVSIGLRSTRLQTDANHELIIPNKTLLDEQVTNLTLSDNFVQAFVTVTIDKDVPVAHAKRQIFKAAFAHPMVLKSPGPIVLLKEFDSYWLTFEVHFSLQLLSSMKCLIVQSQILESICEQFQQTEAAKKAAETTEEKSDSSTSDETTDDESKVAATAPIAGVQQMSAGAMLNEIRRSNGTLKLKR